MDLSDAQRASLEALTRQDGYDGSVSARAQIVLWRADGSMALRLAGGSCPEAVELDTSGDADDAGLIFAGGEVPDLLGGPWAGPVGSVADEESRVEDLEQEGGQGQVKILRGKSPP